MNCKICGKEFEGKEGTKYCSENCRCIGWRIYMREREYKKRAQAKLSEEQRQKMEWLVENQEVEDNYVLEKECWVCNSKENLLAHHVKYNPPLKKTLCSSCHTFFHRCLLRAKRVKSRNV